MIRPIDLATEQPIGVRYEKRDGIARVTLDRPERANSLNYAMHRSMHAIWLDIRDDPSVRVTILTGAGERHFCTGWDVTDSDMGNQTSTLRNSQWWTNRENEVWKPTIVAVNGLASGQGLQFVVDADIVVAADSAMFMDSHVNVGMVGALENIGLALRLPLGLALRMSLQGRTFRLPAPRAYAVGLVDELVPGPELMSAAEDIARATLDTPPLVVAHTLRAIWETRTR